MPHTHSYAGVKGVVRGAHVERHTCCSCVCSIARIQGERGQRGFCLLEVGWESGECGGEPGTGWRMYCECIIMFDGDKWVIGNMRWYRKSLLWDSFLMWGGKCRSWADFNHIVCKITTRYICFDVTSSYISHTYSRILKILMLTIFEIQMKSVIGSRFRKNSYWKSNPYEKELFVSTLKIYYLILFDKNSKF